MARAKTCWEVKGHSAAKWAEPYNDVRFGLLGGSIVDSNALLRAKLAWHRAFRWSRQYHGRHFGAYVRTVAMRHGPNELESEMKAVKKKDTHSLAAALVPVAPTSRRSKYQWKRLRSQNRAATRSSAGP